MYCEVVEDTCSGNGSSGVGGGKIINSELCLQSCSGSGSGISGSGVEIDSSPLSQDFIFYSKNKSSSSSTSSSDDITTATATIPRIHLIEQSWEPSLTAAIPKTVLENIRDALGRSVSYWTGRYHLERMRSGR